MVLKRLMVPGQWPIEKKTKKFAVQISPGPHSHDMSMPLGMIIRDMLGYASTMNEVMEILRKGHVRVNGAVRASRGFPVGLMDVLSVGDESYRMTVGKRGLSLTKIEKKEANIRLLRINNKTVLRGGRMQLNFHDGTNMLVEKDDYKTGDVLVYNFAEKKVKDKIGFEKGAVALVTKGNNMGSVVKIDDIIVTRSSMENQVVANVQTKKIKLPKSYVFVVGRESPVIRLDGVA